MASLLDNFPKGLIDVGANCVMLPSPPLRTRIRPTFGACRPLLGLAQRFNVHGPSQWDRGTECCTPGLRLPQESRAQRTHAHHPYATKHPKLECPTSGQLRNHPSKATRFERIETNRDEPHGGPLLVPPCVTRTRRAI